MKYKNILIFIVALLGLISCKKEINVPKEDYKKLFGKWEWVYSTGGLAGGVITPETENYNLEIEYKKNGIYKEFKDGKRIEKFTFHFEKAESIFSSGEDYLIFYSKGKFSKKGVMYHSFNFIGNDTLLLNEECYDCYGNLYVRKK